MRFDRPRGTPDGQSGPDEDSAAESTPAEPENTTDSKGSRRLGGEPRTPSSSADGSDSREREGPNKPGISQSAKGLGARRELDSRGRPKPRDPRDVSADVAAMQAEIKARYQPPNRDPRRDVSADVAAMREEIRARSKPPRDIAAEVAAMREEIRSRFEARDRDPAAWRRDMARPAPPEPDLPASAPTKPDPPSPPETPSAQTEQKNDQKTDVTNKGDPNASHRDNATAGDEAANVSKAEGSSTDTIRGGGEVLPDQRSEQGTAQRENWADTQAARANESGRSHDRHDPFDPRNDIEARRSYNPVKHLELSTDLPGELNAADRSKTWGRLYDGKGDAVWEAPQSSRDQGPASEVGWKALGLPDSRLAIRGHLEAHVAAQMRQEGRTECVLYIDRAVCPYDRNRGDGDQWKMWPTCDRYLPRMLPPDAKLTVYGPTGFCKTYTGTPDSPDQASANQHKDQQ